MLFFIAIAYDDNIIKSAGVCGNDKNDMLTFILIGKRLLYSVRE